LTSFVEYKDQLLALGVTPGSPASKTQALASLKADPNRKKASRVLAQVEADILSWAVCDLKVSADSFTTQIPILEDKVKHLEDKVVEGLKEVRTPSTLPGVNHSSKRQLPEGSRPAHQEARK
jgi:hypothetical protein